MKIKETVSTPLITRTIGRTTYADMSAMETLLAGSGLDWTVLRPSGLFDAETVSDYRLQEDHADGIFTSRADLVEYMRTSLPANVITEHRVTHPDITVDGDTATGSWYLQDRVMVADFNFMLIGAAFYRDTYRRTEAGWKISGTGYDRTYDATMSLEGLNFTLKPGRAIASD